MQTSTEDTPSRHKRTHMLKGRYQIVYKLGEGTFSSVWLGIDTHNDTAYVAIKRIKNSAKHRQAALNEIRMLRKVTEQQKDKIHIVRLIDSFEIEKDTQKQLFIVMTAAGPNLLESLVDHTVQRLPVTAVKHLMFHLLKGLDFLHRKCGIIHTDIKPENVCIGEYSYTANASIPPQPISDTPRSIICDLGNACWIDDKTSSCIQTRQYRAPEVILEAGYNEKCDIWSAGCLAMELLTGHCLFSPQERAGVSKDEDHLGLIVDLTGECCVSLARGTRYKEMFHANGELLKKTHRLQRSIQNELQKENVAKEEHTPIEEFVLPMLRINPAQRASAYRCLQSSWLSTVKSHYSTKKQTDTQKEQQEH